MIVRPAADVDLDSIRSIARRYGNLASWPERPDYLDQELATGTLTVCEDAGEVIAFGGALTRQRMTHLADLFVRPDRLGTGIGKAVLAKTLPVNGERLTFASADPRALPLYVKFGMLPLAPLLYLTGDTEAARRLADPDVTLAVAGPAVIRDLDRSASGRDRPQDLEFLHTAAGAHGFVALRGSEVIGYGYCRLVDVPGHDSPSAFLGPSGGRSKPDAVRTATALLRWAAEQASQITIPVFGPNPATPILLEASFRIDDIDTYMASRVGLLDLAYYFPSLELG